MVAGHGGRILPAGGDRRTRLVFMVRTWRRAASARHALTPRQTRVARPGLHATSRTGFPGRKQAAVPVLRLYRRDVPRPRRARPLPAQAQAQCRENKRTPAPINRAHRQPGGFRACGTLPAVVRHAPTLIGCRTIPDGRPTAENGQRSADGRRRTMGRGL